MQIFVYILAPDSPTDFNLTLVQEKQIGQNNDIVCNTSLLVTWMAPQHVSLANEIEHYIVSWHQIPDDVTGTTHVLPRVSFIKKSLYKIKILPEYYITFIILYILIVDAVS